MVVAAALFFAWMLLPLPASLAWALLGLPAIFFLFSFVDLKRTIKTKAAPGSRASRTAVLFLGVALLYQLFSPITPANFIWRNSPLVFVQQDNSLMPLIHPGDLVACNTMSYSSNLFFLDRPIWHSLPEPGDPIRVIMEDGTERAVFVIGRPEEDVQIIDGQLLLNGSPQSLGPLDARMPETYPLTLVAGNSILVADLLKRPPDRFLQVPLGNVKGRFHRLF